MSNIWKDGTSLKTYDRVEAADDAYRTAKQTAFANLRQRADAMIRTADDAQRRSIEEAAACDKALRERRYQDAKRHLDKSKRLAVLAITLTDAKRDGLVC